VSTWRYEAATKTIRSVPENYWICSMDSWDKAVDHEKNAALIASAPGLKEENRQLLSLLRASVQFLTKAIEQEAFKDCVAPKAADRVLEEIRKAVSNG
jgi:hypothetical protein